MLPFFPTPYEDELLYSVLARYHIWSQNISLKATVNDLFGRRTASAVVDLPNGLETLCSELSIGSSITSDYLIENHTLFPLFRPFLPADRAERIFRCMKFGGDIHTTIGAMPSSIHSPKWLRYCPNCVQADVESVGEPYWHRTHQVPGVEVCPLHQKRLINSSVSTTSRQNKHAFVALAEDVMMDEHEQSETDPHLIAIAEAVHWLLENDVSVLGLKELRDRYVSKLKQMNPVTHQKTVRQRDLLNEFSHFYGNQLLTELNCEIDYSEQDNWLSQMVRKPRKVSHPLRHILLMRFLELTPEQFFKNGEKYHPFGNGPWLCLNPVANHYHKPVVEQCEVTRDYKTRVPVGTFKCSCGFVYSRRGPDKDEADRYKIGRIKQFGHVWEKELLRVTIDKKMSFHAAARHLQCDPVTAKRQLEKIRNKMQYSEVAATITDDFEIKLTNRRAAWLEIIKANPEKTRTQIRQMVKADFTWLYRHDRQWLTINTPAPKKRKKYTDNRVDWQKRDAEIYSRVKAVIDEELKCWNKPTRLTISSIGKVTGELHLLQKHLDKLPKTKKFIQSYAETIEEFQIRRVEYVGRKLRENQMKVMEWEIVREAGLRPGYSDKVKEKIKKELVSSRYNL